MIKYKLICKECNIDFDSWFGSSSEYEKLKKKKLLSCTNCNSHRVEKTIMSPKFINNLKSEKINSRKFYRVKKTIQNYQKFIKDNFKYVGDNFAYEARSLHYNGKKKSKSIYGTASIKEIKELKEEGIDTQIIPWIKNVDN